MKRVARAVLLLAVAVAYAGCATKPETVPPLEKSNLQSVLDAWSSMDMSKPAALYSHDAGVLYFDVAPRKYSGWDEYAKGTAEMFKSMKSISFKLNDDAQVHSVGNLAWSAATVDGVAVMGDGSKMDLPARWTSVWERRNNQWIIVHDHFSAPLPEPAAAPAPAPKQ
jgi:ketosteroid isomerase-like protein